MSKKKKNKQPTPTTQSPLEEIMLKMVEAQQKMAETVERLSQKVDTLENKDITNVATKSVLDNKDLPPMGFETKYVIMYYPDKPIPHPTPGTTNERLVILEDGKGENLYFETKEEAEEHIKKINLRGPFIRKMSVYNVL